MTQGSLIASGLSDGFGAFGSTCHDVLIPMRSLNSIELFDAADAGSVERIRDLLNRGCDVNHRTVDGQTALCYAVSRGHIEATGYLLDRHADVNIVTYEGMFPLSIAVAQRNRRLVELLLERGASVHYPAYYEYFPPIHEAAMSGDYRCLDYLLQAGANVNQVDRYLGSVLYAVYEGSMKREKKLGILQFLLSRGANPNLSVRSRTLMKFAVDCQDVELMELMVVGGGNLKEAKEDAQKFYQCRGDFVYLVDRALTNPLKLQHLCRKAIVRVVSAADEARGRAFSRVLDKTGVCSFARLGLPQSAVEFLEYKRLCLSCPVNGDIFH